MDLDNKDIYIYIFVCNWTSFNLYDFRIPYQYFKFLKDFCIMVNVTSGLYLFQSETHVVFPVHLWKADQPQSLCIRKLMCFSSEL